ncbi:MAG: hypothetical protein Q8R55_02150 [Candidatus Taylorbacteria bacterium]|nr:hypothetical protein [Candidatus Taylorbacteria bacterium]
MKKRWLNLMLHFSGVINKYKLKMIETTGPKIIFHGFSVLVLEILNLLLALPAYAFIAPQEFAGNDPSAIKTYRLRRIVSLSVLAGMALSVLLWISVSFFGLIIFPGKSRAAIASWDFNTPLAYNYDTTKIQITDGAVIFKASQTVTPTIETTAPMVEPAPTIESTPSTETITEPVSEPVVEPAPAPVVEPAPDSIDSPQAAPVVEPAPAPAPDPGPLLWRFLKPEVAFSQTNSCFATLQTITPLVVTPFVKWTGFFETANKNGGEIYYALSGDGGLTWLYWNGSAWTDAGAENGNIALDINDHISSFPAFAEALASPKPTAERGSAGEPVTQAGTLMFRAKFVSDCASDILLLSLTADYQDQPMVIISLSDTSDTPTTVITSESDPTVVAVEDSISSSTDTSAEGGTEIVIPATDTSLSTDITSGTSLETGTGVEVPTDTSDTTSVGTNVDTSLTADTTVDTGIVTPIVPTESRILDEIGTFSVHVVIETTGNPGNTLYSIPGLFSLSEGPDNGLVINVTGTDLQTTTLSSSANVTVGDHIVALVYDGSTLNLYIDGMVSASLTTPIVIAPPVNVSTSIGCVSARFILEALTLAQINANYLECSNQAPQLNITDALQNTRSTGSTGSPQAGSGQADDPLRQSSSEAGGFIGITYMAIDTDNDFVSLSVYEYSVTGAFNGEEKIMTAASFDTEHDGASGLNATSSGTEHTFIWNVEADLPNYAGNVYVRLRANDGLAGGLADTFYPVRIDTKDPVISSFTGNQTIDPFDQLRADSGSVAITYVLSETSTPVQVTLALSSDGGLNWVVPTHSATGDIGEVSGSNHTIIWNADSDLPDFEGMLTVRITAADKYGNVSVTTTNFDVDTRAPLGLSALAGIESNTGQIIWHWSPSDDTNFDRYIITYGTDNQSVIDGSVDNPVNVKLWGPSKDSDLSLAGTDRTVITGLTADTLYYARITAYDDYGHESSSLVASFRTQAPADAQSPGPLRQSSSEASEATEVIKSEISILPPTIPVGGFKVVIDSGAINTGNKNVALTLTGGDDTALMLISNRSDLSDGNLQEYSTATEWNLCAGLDSCDSGTYRVYAKFYTSFGVGGSTVSDGIILNISVPETPSENSGSVGQVDSQQVGASSGGGSPGSGIGPVISLTTNENQTRNENILINNRTNNIENVPVAQNSNTTPSANSGQGITSSFVPTTNSVLQSVPGLKAIAESRESGVLAKPQVALVKKSLTGQTINFTGTGIPKAKIALFIHSDQVVVYTTDADEKGRWSFSHDQSEIELAPGEHTVFAVTYDPGSKVKSKPSIVSTFEVKKNSAMIILAYTNLPTTILTLLVLLGGTLYIYSRRRKMVK